MVIFASVCKNEPKKPGVNQIQASREEVDSAFRVTNEVQSNMLKLSAGE